MIKHQIDLILYHDGNSSLDDVATLIKKLYDVFNSPTFPIFIKVYPRSIRWAGGVEYVAELANKNWRVSEKIFTGVQQFDIKDYATIDFLNIPNGHLLTFTISDFEKNGQKVITVILSLKERFESVGYKVNIKGLENDESTDAQLMESNSNISSKDIQITPIILNAEEMKKYFLKYTVKSALEIINNFSKANDEFELALLGGKIRLSYIAKYSLLNSITVGRYLKAFREAGFSSIDGIPIPINIKNKKHLNSDNASM